MNTGSKRKGVQCKLMTQLRAVGEPMILRKKPCSLLPTALPSPPDSTQSSPSQRRNRRRPRCTRQSSSNAAAAGSRAPPPNPQPTRAQKFPQPKAQPPCVASSTFTEEMNMKSMVSPKEMTAKIRGTCRLSQGEEAIAGEEPAGALPSHPGRRAAPGRVRRPFR
jgi:hypothetical protein